MREISRNELLIDQLAESVTAGRNYFPDQVAIAKVIRFNFVLTREDAVAINQLVALVKQMDQAQLLDTAHQSDNLRALEAQYTELKQKILARMNSQRSAFYEIILTETQAPA